MQTLKSLIPAFGLGLFLWLPAPAAAQTNEDCLSCHSDKTLKGKRDGATIALYVDSARLAASRHGPAKCVDCHTDLAKKELPHAEKLARATCRNCHADEAQQHTQSLHGKAVARGDLQAPTCGDCHGSHEIVAVKDPRSPVLPSRVSSLCGSCHREGAPAHRRAELRASEVAANYPERIHGELLAKKGLVVAATCVSCHTAHQILPHTDDRSSVARENLAATCARCHARLEEVHRDVIQADLWKKGPGAVPACVVCHAPHKASAGAYGGSAAARECLRCHGRNDITSSKDGHPVSVETAALGGSVHAKLPCVQCHSDVGPSHARPSGTPARKVECATCHAAAAQLYRQSTHGQMETKNDQNAPSCAECHGTHGILGRRDPRSPTFPINVPTLCARCHRTGQKAAVRYTGAQTEIVERYTESIHGKGLIKSGLVVTATCTSCHTAHSVLPRDSVKSSVNAGNIPETCGACHVGIQELFEKSVHSAKVTATGKQLPVCNDCHSAHTISRTDAQGFKLTIMGRCGRCHEQIAERYFESYHGKVSRLGFTKTAQCYDCHGSHDILPARNALAHLNRANVVATCQKCHPGAGPKFTSYVTHATHTDRQKYPWLFWSFWAMTALLVGTFTVAGAHTLLWLPRTLKIRRELGKLRSAPGSTREFERFTRLNRVLHVVMIVSFISLAATGMSLKFSHTKWASVLSHLLGGFETAGYIHRFAALLMIGLFVTHLVDLVRRKKKSWKDFLLGPNSMVPTLQDLKDFAGNIRWFLGLGERPRFGRWTYWEKIDYMAVFWGMMVIGSTGLSLWFPVFVTRVFPGWLLNVATIIHSDEALLATGFIFTVHFFNTHLRPEKFPMDLVVFTGRMSVEELKEDKPAEYEALVASGELEQHLVEPYQPIVIRTIRFFAWIALAIGIAMVLWILYAMLFAAS